MSLVISRIEEWFLSYKRLKGIIDRLILRGVMECGVLEKELRIVR
jgi:hypothetical protein